MSANTLWGWSASAATAEAWGLALRPGAAARGSSQYGEQVVSVTCGLERAHGTADTPPSCLLHSGAVPVSGGHCPAATLVWGFFSYHI